MLASTVLDDKSARALFRSLRSDVTVAGLSGVAGQFNFDCLTPLITVSSRKVHQLSSTDCGAGPNVSSISFSVQAQGCPNKCTTPLPSPFTFVSDTAPSPPVADALWNVGDPQWDVSRRQRYAFAFHYTGRVLALHLLILASLQTNGAGHAGLEHL